jgi:Secretion system C-terminal sorting domain
MENDTTPTACMGYLTAIAIAGVSPYTYLWNDPSAQTDETAMSLCAGTYTCVITDAMGCTASTTATVFAAIGIEENDLQLGVYPNPTNDLLQVEAVFSGQAVQIALTNASGSTDLLLDAGVLSGPYSRSFDLSQLPAGIYTLRIREDEITVAVMKIVKL